MMHCQYHTLAHLIEDHRSGDVICSDCGLVVIDRVVDCGADWHTFDQSRVGSAENPLLDGKDLFTRISANESFKIRIPYDGTKKGFLMIDDIAERLHIPTCVTDKSKRIYKDFKTKTKRISSIENVAAACLYLACRQDFVPRTLMEISGATNSSKIAIGRSYKRILSLLEINVDQCINSFDYIDRFTANLGLTFKTSKRAKEMLKEVNKSELTFGMSPISVSAGVVFMASALECNPRSVENVSEVTGVSVTSIKNVYKKLATRF